MCKLYRRDRPDAAKLSPDDGAGAPNGRYARGNVVMAEWIGGLLSGLPMWLAVIILIVICVVAVIGILAFAPGMVGGEPVWLFRRRKK